MAKKRKKLKKETFFVEKEELEMLALALRIAIDSKKATPTLLQTRLKIGYAHAARLVDILQEYGVIGKSPEYQHTGAKPILKEKPPEPPKLEKPKEEKKKSGPVPIYSVKIAQEICDRIASGESVRQICRDEHMPEARTVYLWLLDDAKKDFQEKYNKARIIQADAMFDEIFEIADDGSNDWMEIEIARGDDSFTKTVPDHEYINRSKLRVDARKWALARMNSNKYGDRMDLTTKGKAIQQPRSAVINYIVPKAAKTA